MSNSQNQQSFTTPTPTPQPSPPALKQKLLTILSTLHEQSTYLHKAHQDRIAALEIQLDIKDRELDGLRREVLLLEGRCLRYEAVLGERERVVGELNGRVRKLQVMFKDRLHSYLDQVDLEGGGQGEGEGEGQDFVGGMDGDGDVQNIGNFSETLSMQMQNSKGTTHSTKKINISQYFMKTIQTSKLSTKVDNETPSDHSPNISFLNTQPRIPNCVSSNNNTNANTHTHQNSIYDHISLVKNFKTSANVYSASAGGIRGGFGGCGNGNGNGRNKMRHDSDGFVRAVDSSQASPKMQKVTSLDTNQFNKPSNKKTSEWKYQTTNNTAYHTRTNTANLLPTPCSSTSTNIRVFHPTTTTTTTSTELKGSSNKFYDTATVKNKSPSPAISPSLSPHAHTHHSPNPTTASTNINANQIHNHHTNTANSPSLNVNVNVNLISVKSQRMKKLQSLKIQTLKNKNKYNLPQPNNSPITTSTGGTSSGPSSGLKTKPVHINIYTESPHPHPHPHAAQQYNFRKQRNSNKQRTSFPSSGNVVLINGEEIRGGQSCIGGVNLNVNGGGFNQKWKELSAFQNCRLAESKNYITY